MEADRFDRISRVLATALSRRRALGLALGSLVALLGDASSEAKGKHSKKKGKTRKRVAQARSCGCPMCQRCTRTGCTPKATDKACSDLGPCRECQNGTCGDKADGARCGTNQTCRSGVCEPSGQRCRDSHRLPRMSGLWPEWLRGPQLLLWVCFPGQLR